MNSDILATYYTLFLVATKIIIASRGEPVKGIMYFIYGLWTLIFWGNMRVIADAIQEKNILKALHVQVAHTGSPRATAQSHIM